MAFPNPHRLVGVISGMIVWAVWFVVVYGLTGVGCDAGWNTSLLMLASTVVALALIARCAWIGFAAWRLRHEAAIVTGRESAQRQRFMGLTMGVLSLLAGIATLLIAVPILMLDPCIA